MPSFSSAAPKRRHLRSLGTRLALATTLLMALVSAGVYGALTKHEHASLLAAKQRAARMVTLLLAEALAPALVFSDEENVRESLAYLESNAEVVQAAVFGVSPDGSVGDRLGELTREQGHTPLSPPRSGAVDRLDVGDTYLDVTRSIRDAEGNRIGVALVRFSLAEEQRSFALLSRSILQVAAAVAVGLTALLLLLARSSVIAPLRHLHVAVGRLKAGALPDGPLLSSLPLGAENEVGDLSRAFVRMAEVIARREQAIATQNDELRLILESVGQGFLVLSADGCVIGQHSAIIERWFGRVQVGRPLWDQLRHYDGTQAEWMELAWENIRSGHMPLALCITQLPKRIETEGASYDFEYRPQLSAADELRSMVVIVSDVTELVARERAEAEQRELAAVLAGLAADRSGFIAFYEDAAQMVQRIVRTAQQDLRQVREDIHTLKGNACVFQLHTLSSLCEQVETRLEAEGGVPNEAERRALTACFERTRQVVERLSDHAAQRELAIGIDEHAELMRAIDRRAPHATLRAMLARATAEPAERLFERFATRLKVLAHALGKVPVTVQVVGNGLRFPKEPFAPLWAAMVHALRNVADHALETPLERERADKPSPAVVTIAAECANEMLTVTICDDGRGIDLGKIHARAAALGRAPRDDQAALALLFSPGFSTAHAEHELSGRGVGLSAIKSAVDELGGTVSVRPLLVGSELRIELPAALLSGVPALPQKVAQKS